jgi:lysine 2,3-aminomutase
VRRTRDYRKSRSIDIIENNSQMARTTRPGPLRTVEALVEAGLVRQDDRAALDAVAERYAIGITREMVALIDPDDPVDPIARQFVPSPDELKRTPEELDDPIGDASHSPIKGIVHRYPDRVLLKPLHACPVYCRFCFRREQVGPGGEALSDAELVAALDYIRRRPEVWEVILTGGDPLILAPRRLEIILRALDDMPHVATLRIHSRVPVVDPARIDADLLAALTTRKPLWLAVHANHPRELTEQARRACGRLAEKGISLLGQTVLLRGVNDELSVLESLFRAMVATGIKPYYLHHPDLAPGTARFRLSIAEGQALMHGLRGRLSGIAQPTYVLDLPGGAGKVPIGPNSVEPGGVRDPAGHLHPYPETEFAGNPRRE